MISKNIFRVKHDEINNFELSDVPVRGISLAGFCLDHLFELAALDVDGSGGAHCLFFLGFFLKHLDLVLQTGEDETDHRGSAIQCAAGIHLLIEWANLRLVALELHTLGILRHF